VLVPEKVEVLGKSCFQFHSQIHKLDFENDSKLQRICRYALANCDSLRSISIPASVDTIEEGAFGCCDGLESCIIAENARLVKIDDKAFSDCRSMRTFYIPRSVEVIGENCFETCHSLRRLRFPSAESLNRLVNDSTLDEVLETLGLGVISSLMTIEIEDCELQTEFDGWSPVADGSSYTTLVQDII
jgi:hypothetical protein